MSNDVRTAIEAYKLKIAGKKYKPPRTLEEMRKRSLEICRKPIRD